MFSFMSFMPLWLKKTLCPYLIPLWFKKIKTAEGGHT